VKQSNCSQRKTRRVTASDSSLDRCCRTCLSLRAGGQHLSHHQQTKELMLMSPCRVLLYGSKSGGDIIGDKRRQHTRTLKIRNAARKVAWRGSRRWRRRHGEHYHRAFWRRQRGGRNSSRVTWRENRPRQRRRDRNNGVVIFARYAWRRVRIRRAAAGMHYMTSLARLAPSTANI